MCRGLMTLLQNKQTKAVPSKFVPGRINHKKALPFLIILLYWMPLFFYQGKAVYTIFNEKNIVLSEANNV